MYEKSIIADKCYVFALEIVRLNQQPKVRSIDSPLRFQLLKSATSIGANVEESIGGYTLKDFLYKNSIAYKEARETHYWLRLLKDSNLIEKKISEKLISDCIEIIKILGAIQSTTRKKMKTGKEKF